MKINLIRERYILPRQARTQRVLVLSFFLPVLFFSLFALAGFARANRSIVERYERILVERREAEEKRLMEALQPSREDREALALVRSAVSAQETRALLAERLVQVSERLPRSCFLEGLEITNDLISIAGRGVPGTDTVSALVAFVNSLNADPDFIGRSRPLRLKSAVETGGFLDFEINNRQ